MSASLLFNGPKLSAKEKQNFVKIMENKKIITRYTFSKNFKSRFNPNKSTAELFAK